MGNIAEYASLEPTVFMQGEPSAYDVIAVIARGYGVGFATLGLMALLVALEGYRNGTRWAWRTMWVLVVTFLSIAVTYMLAGESYTLTLSILVLGIVALAALLLARTGRAR